MFKLYTHSQQSKFLNIHSLKVLLKYKTEKISKFILWIQNYWEIYGCSSPELDSFPLPYVAEDITYVCICEPKGITSLFIRWEIPPASGRGAEVTGARYLSETTRGAPGGTTEVNKRVFAVNKPAEG